jgi:purine-binding chemotaxis protein CheW
MSDTLVLDKKADNKRADKPRPEPEVRGKLQVLGFKLAGRNFGLDIESVIEIVKQVAVTEMPEAPEYVEGIIDIREKVVPLINLQKMLRIGNRRHDLDTQIIVVYGENGVVGLLVDDVSDIVPIHRKDVMSPGRSASPLSGFVSGVVDIHDDLLLLLDVNMLVDHEHWGEVISRSIVADSELDAESRIDRQILMQRAGDLKKKNVEENYERRRLVTFRLGEEWYGFDIAHVKEISDIVDIYFIPSAPPHIAGTINLRGVIIPIVDLARFLGLAPSVDGEATSIIVVEQNNISMGILADRIGDIEEIAAESVEPPLATVDKDKVDCLEGGVELNGTLMGILRLEHIIQASASQ